MMTQDKKHPTAIPDHLPERLAICSWQWAWLSAAHPDEPYANLDEVMEQLCARKFNCIRVDAGLNWCFDANGVPRGTIPFQVMHPGYNSRFRVISGRKGIRQDVLERVVELMTLAKQYDIYVILTSWEYMHSLGVIGDPALTDEINAVPEPERLIRLARQHDYLLRALTEKGLERHIAFVEPHNEINYSFSFKGDQARRIHEDAIAFLRDRHPDILISGDMGKHLPDEAPRNSQVYDVHAYVGAELYHEGLYHKTIVHPEFDPGDPRALPLLDYLLEENTLPFQEFAAAGPDAGEGWAARMWMYHNLDISRFDRFMLDQYAEREESIKKWAAQLYGEIANEAARRNVPVAIEEGGFFYPPQNSRWEESERGLEFFDYITDLAIENEFWGFLATTYNGPEIPIWWSNPDWQRRANERFLSGTAKQLDCTYE